ncbi:TPA: oligosaccharide repeat unit polymerase [Vibrio vulnificus]|nr:oligosaccharide repeat unit polymerase [Vibrio vulnificus]HAS6204018.1 oligosaccharide repeat unit polymerase [Vibrio vulnificus]HAS6229468.1 oligosaccharide repeat unit polymerase [Vibrio vulnificus]HAT8512883.1 oligosaccharide repeat unit polymerase [Vibrio vulnificus]HDY7859012.1 oligosaccharide repeat unit polymerase [Vibrio vulnificus]
MSNKNFIQLLISLLCVFTTYFMDDALIGVIAIVFVYLSNLKLNATHYLSDPRTLFLGFYVCYAVIFPLRIIFTGLTILPMDFNALAQSVLYQLVGIIVMITIFNIACVRRYNSSKNFFEVNAEENVGYKSRTSERIVIFIVFFIIVIGGVLVFKSGATSKRELLDSNSGINSIIGYVVLFGLIAICLRALRVSRTMQLDPILYCFFILLLVNMLVTGERDSLFRFIILMLFVFFDFHKRANFKITVFLLLMAVFVVPISQLFKSALLSGSIGVVQTGLELLLSNEFVSAGQNLYSLIYFGVDHSVLFVFTDLVRAFTPSVLLDSLNIQSTVAWFNNTYRVENSFSGTAGWGFGIIAEGYLIGDLAGIVFVSFALSLFISFFYRRSFISEYYYVFYLCLITTSIYVLRGDLANLFSQSLKINGILVIFLYFLHKLFIRIAR